MGKRMSMRERTRQQAEERTSYGGGGTSIKLPDGIEFFSPEKGNTKLNFLPYEVTDKRHPANIPVGEQWFERPFKVHRDIGIDGNRYICPTSIGKPCPICEHAQQLKRSGDADEDLLKALRPKDRCLYNVQEVGEDDIKVWDISFFLFTEFLDEEIRNAEDEDDVAGFAELEDGKTLKIRFKEKKFGTSKYCETSRIDFLDRDNIDDEILDDVANLDECLVIKSYEELERIYYEMDDDDENETGDDDKKDEKKSSRRSSKDKDEKKDKKSSRRRSKKDDDEGDDDEKEKKTSRRRRKSKDDDEGDDDKKDEKKTSRRRSSKKKDEDEKSPAEKKKRKRAERDAKKKAEEKGDAGDCPFGHTFGDDCDETDDCEKCDNWDACFDKSEE